MTNNLQPTIQRKNTLLYEQRIKNEIQTLFPTSSPVITIKSSLYNSEEWNKYNTNLHKIRQQQKVNSEWTAVYNKEGKINCLIQMLFLIEGIERSETSRWRKVYDNIVFVKRIIKEENIFLEAFLELIKNLNISINYLQEIDSDEFKNLIYLILRKTPNLMVLEKITSNTNSIKPKRLRQKKNSDLYKKRINKEYPLLPPTVSLVILIRSSSYNNVEWYEYNAELHKSRQQQKVNVEWAAVYSIFIQFYQLMSFQLEGIKTETTRLRKVYELVVLVKEIIKQENISLETFLKNIIDLNITINYLQEVESEIFKNLVDLVMKFRIK
ncbi:11329_t:CDS:2, partial [Dentiscutata heterogama]